MTAKRKGYDNVCRASEDKPMKSFSDLLFRPTMPHHFCVNHPGREATATYKDKSYCGECEKDLCRNMVLAK